MASISYAEPATQGHVILYGRNPRWRRSVAKSLAAGGHSLLAAAEPSELRRLLLSQRFDLMALRVRDEVEAKEVGEALQDVPLPPHSIVAGSESALAILQPYQRQGTLRFSPGRLQPEDLRWLVGASLSSGVAQPDVDEHGSSSAIEEIDLEEVIDNAAAHVYPRAKRKRQRFQTIVEGPDGAALADATKLERTLVAVLDLVVSLAPRGALVSVDARAQNRDWRIRIGASTPGGSVSRLTETVRSRTPLLRSAYRDITAQGGLLWMEVSGRATLGVCLSLPLAPRSSEEPLALGTSMAAAEGR